MGMKRIKKCLLLLLGTIVLLLCFGCSTKQVLPDLGSMDRTPNEKEETQKSILYFSSGDFDAQNPINTAFEKDFEIASSTVEYNYLAEKYLEAWKLEWENIIDELQAEYEFEEDKILWKVYKDSYEVFVHNASEIEIINWSDTSIEPGEERWIGTGAFSAAWLVEAGLYKNQVFYLINKYYDGKFGVQEGGYRFIYRGEGAQIERLRDE